MNIKVVYSLPQYTCNAETEKKNLQKTECIFMISNIQSAMFFKEIDSITIPKVQSLCVT